MQTYDVIVVGLGAIGSATLYQLAKRGVRVLGIDQFSPPHQMGSSHGESRITRFLTGEGDVYVQLAQRTRTIWHELEAQTGRPMVQPTGGYIIEPTERPDSWHSDGSFLETAATMGNRYQIAYERLSAAALQTRLPALNFPADCHALYELSGAIVQPDIAIDTHLREAKRLGAHVHTHEKMLSFVDNGSVQIRTDKGSYTADRLILTTGAWLANLLPEQLTVYRQIMFWFEAEERGSFTLDRLPWTIWLGQKQTDFFSTFPTLDGNTMKLMTEQYVETAQPDTVDRIVQQHEIDQMIEEHVKPKVNGVKHNCVQAIACAYTMTADHHFLLDHHSESGRILIASCCSGHGFKHSAALGEAIAQTIVGDTSDIDLSLFANL